MRSKTLSRLGDKRVMFFSTPKPGRNSQRAFLKSIDGQPVTASGRFEAAKKAERLEHLRPLLDVVEGHKKKRRRATEKHPVTEMATRAKGSGVVTKAPKKVVGASKRTTKG